MNTSESIRVICDNNIFWSGDSVVVEEKRLEVSRKFIKDKIGVEELSEVKNVKENGTRDLR